MVLLAATLILDWPQAVKNGTPVLRSILGASRFITGNPAPVGRNVVAHIFAIGLVSKELVELKKLCQLSFLADSINREISRRTTSTLTRAKSAVNIQGALFD
jgi:hypothetical protein